MLGKAEYYGEVMLVAGRWLRRCFEKERGVLRGARGGEGGAQLQAEQEAACCAMQYRAG